MNITIDDNEVSAVILHDYFGVKIGEYESIAILNELEFGEDTWKTRDLLDVLETCEIYGIGVYDTPNTNDFIHKYENELPRKIYARENYMNPDTVLEEDEEGYLISLCDSINSDCTNRGAVYNPNFIAVFEN